MLAAAAILAFAYFGKSVRNRGALYAVGIAALAIGFVGPSVVLGAISGAPAAPPAAQGLWDVQFASYTDDIATATDVISADGHTVDVYGSSAGGDFAFVATNDFTVTVTIINLNSGDAATTYQVRSELSSVGVVTDQNAGTSFAMLLKDVSTGAWDVAWSSSGAGGQVADKYFEGITLGDTVIHTLVAEVNPSAWDAGPGPMQSGQTYRIGLMVAGQPLTVAFHLNP